MKKYIGILILLFAFLASCTDIKKEYYKNGKLKYEVEYKDGEKHGVSRTYYKNGQLEMEGEYINGKREGLFKYYYRNGQIEQATNFVNGMEEGIIKEYYESGTLKAEALFKNGKQDGITKEYYESGELKGILNYKDGIKQGAYKSYYSNGQLKLDAVLENGVTVYYKEYNEQGEVIDMLYDFTFDPPIDTIYAGKTYDITMRRTGPTFEMIGKAEMHIQRKDALDSDTSFHIPDYMQLIYEPGDLKFTYTPKELGNYILHAYFMEKETKDTLMQHYTKEFTVMQRKPS